MTTTRMTGSMRSQLESRLADLDARLEALGVQRSGDDSVEAAALLMQLDGERADIADALRDAMVIDDEPFDTDEIEVGDTITIRDGGGDTERYVLIDGRVRSRARHDWVSLSSPLGAALLGRSKGDRLDIESPGGTMTYIVIDFERASEEPSVTAFSKERERAGRRGLLPSEAFIG